jgi:hypothetical protein
MGDRQRNIVGSWNRGGSRKTVGRKKLGQIEKQRAVSMETISGESVEQERLDRSKYLQRLVRLNEELWRKLSIERIRRKILRWKYFKKKK